MERAAHLYTCELCVGTPVLRNRADRFGVKGEYLPSTEGRSKNASVVLGHPAATDPLRSMAYTVYLVANEVLKTRNHTGHFRMYLSV